jgi:hypothetical protein
VINPKLLESMEYFRYLGCMITSDAKCTHEIQSKIALAKPVFNRKKTLFTRKLDFNLRKELVKYHI